MVVVVGGIQQMAACCLAGTQSWSEEAEGVSDDPLSGHCQELSDPPTTPAATEAEVKNRGSLVTLHVKASCILRGDTCWKQNNSALQP